MTGDSSRRKESETGGVILVADDEDPLRRALARQLRADGHAVVEATNGAHALELLGEHDVEILLTDISMPDIDGVELLRRAREVKPDVPVLLMTGAPAIASAMKAVEYGATDYLTKPLDMAKVERSVTRALQLHRDAVEQRAALDSAVRAKAAPVAPTNDPSLLVTAGTVLDRRYRVVRPIGTGGMGAVYEAKREDLGRMPVAVKILHPNLAAREESVRRFRREAEVVAALEHPNIVGILDFVNGEDGSIFLVMELLRGRTLSTAIANDPPFSEQRVAFVTSQILAALEAAHEMKVVHRDLKPENVFLTTISGMSDVVKVLDFGIAKLVSEPVDTRLTQTGTVLGTPAYMAPEYARGEQAGVLGDLYSMGCVMYEMITRKQPFVASNYNALLYAIQEKNPEPIEAARPVFSRELAAVVARSMAKDPALRFQSAHEMRDALARWLTPSSTVPATQEHGTGLGSAPTEPSVIPPRKPT